MKKGYIYFLASFVLLTNSSNGQESTSFFNEYHKLSLQLGISRYSGSETSTLPTDLEYKFNNYTSPHFGLYYDVLQSNNLNFKIGLSVIKVREIEQFRIGANQIPDVDRDFALIIDTDTENSYRLNCPLTVEYILQNKLFFNSSLILGYHQEFGNTENEYRVNALQNEESTQLNSTYNRSTAPWYFNTQLGVGMYFPFEKWMLRANIYYNFALQNLYEGEFTFSNLAQSPDTSGEFSFRGDSFGIEFSIYLKKKRKD